MPSELLAAAVGKSLDGLFLRQLVTAQNIANANSPSYTPLRVSFEQTLAEIGNASDSSPSRMAQRIRDTHAEVFADRLSNLDEPVRVDLEIANASETAMRYSALITIFDRWLQLENMAVTGG